MWMGLKASAQWAENACFFGWRESLNNVFPYNFLIYYKFSHTFIAEFMKQNLFMWLKTFVVVFLVCGCADQNSGDLSNQNNGKDASDFMDIQGSEIQKLKDPVQPQLPRNPDKENPATSKPDTNAAELVQIPESKPSELIVETSEKVFPAPASTNEVSKNTIETSVAELAGVIENQRPQTLSTNQIGNSLKDPEPLATDPDYLTVNFNRLASFNYEILDEFMFIEEGAEVPEKVPTIPDNIKKLNGEKVAVTGFMLPLKVEKGLVTELLLMRDQSMCCFGTVPEINEWISIKTEKDGKGFKPINDQAVTFFGELKVGEIRENGYLVGIYEMEGNKMVGPGNLKEF